MTQNTINYFSESEIFDLNLKKKISYTKIIPYRYASVSPPYVDETTYQKIIEYEKLFNNTSVLDYLKTWYTEDEKEIFGYSVSPSTGIPYAESGILGVFYDKPENNLLKKLHESNHEVFLIGNYFEKGGNGKYIEVAIKNAKSISLDYFSSLEKYDVIKSTILENELNKFLPIYLIDLDNEQNFGMNIDTFFMPYDNNNANVALKRDELYYLNLKKQYYKNFVNNNILTQEQYDYIFEVSSGAERTILKFRWEESKLSYIELESICVFEFDKVWTRS